MMSAFKKVKNIILRALARSLKSLVLGLRPRTVSKARRHPELTVNRHPELGSGSVSGSISGSRNKFGMTIAKFGMTRILSSLLLSCLLLVNCLAPVLAVTFTAGSATRDGPGPFAGGVMCGAIHP